LGNISKRSKSIICSTDDSYAQGFSRSKISGMSSGGVYIILPIGNPNISFGTREDFWYDFKEFCVDELNYRLNSWFNLYNIDKPTDFNSLKFNLELVELNMKKSNKQFFLGGINGKINLKNSFESGNSLLDILWEHLDPHKNDIKSEKLNYFPKVDRREVWFSSPCYAIKESILKSIIL